MGKKVSVKMCTHKDLNVGDRAYRRYSKYKNIYITIKERENRYLNRYYSLFPAQHNDTAGSIAASELQGLQFGPKFCLGAILHVLPMFLWDLSGVFSSLQSPNKHN